MEQEIKYTVAVAGFAEPFDEDTFPQYFYIHSNDELEKFLHQMIIVYKKNVIVYQGVYGDGNL